MCVQAFAQHRVYCEIVGTRKLNTKIKIEVDFGQNVSTKGWKSNKLLVDDNGKEIEFNSMVDAMNYMGELGWKFVQAYAITHTSGLGQENVYHFLLYKDLSDDEFESDGLKTLDDYRNSKKINNNSLRVYPKTTKN